MKITIDTKEDSKEELQHAVDLLNKLLNNSQASSAPAANFNADPAATAGFASMMSSDNVSKEEVKADDDGDDDDGDGDGDVPEIQLY